MQLDDRQRALLAGEAGQAARTAMEILVALGNIFGARELAAVAGVQVAGVSYHNLGDAGLEFLEDMAVDGRVVVPTTLNPAGMDLERSAEMGIDADFARGQNRIVEAFARMGVTISCTCTPYLAGHRPAAGATLAWSESSAVTFANSVLGARSNREGGPSALAAALCGCTPIYGLHLDANRCPTLRVQIDTALVGADDWGLLGAAIGRRASGALPYLCGAGDPGEDALKALSAALPTYGAQAMFHLEGVTPEAAQHAPPPTLLRVDRALLEETRQALEGPADALDLVALGCPHASLAELEQLATLLDGRQVQVPLWISTARTVDAEARQRGLHQRIEASGARIWCDTCFAVAPLRGRFARVASNSAKGCYYGTNHNRFAMRLGSLERCVAAALAGRWA